METENDVFVTRELDLASALVSLKFFTTNITFQIEGEKGKKRGYFEFENTPELKDTIRKFWKDELLVNPRAFAAEEKVLKRRVFNINNSPKVEFE